MASKSHWWWFYIVYPKGYMWQTLKGTIYLGDPSLRLVVNKDDMDTSEGIVNHELFSNNEEINQISVIQSISPNPSVDNTEIKFKLQKDEYVKMNIYDISGRLVKQVENTNLQSGDYSYSIQTSEMSSGIYIIKLNTDTSEETKKFVVVK
jgi:hypothetical protein